MMSVPYLRVPGEPISEKPLVMRWNSVRCHIERLVEELEVGHVMADVGF